MLIPDKLTLSSTLPTFVNPTTSAGSITLSGTVINGNTATFSTTLTTSIAGNLFRSDIYASNSLESTRTLINTLLAMTTDIKGYVYVSSESVQLELSYNGQNLTVTYSVFNGTGADITLTTQTISLECVQYQLPF